MANLPRNVCDKVDRLERNFAVSTVIFRKFEPIFKSIFNFKSRTRDRPGSRKQRRPPCSYSEVFAFCWDLFVLAKGNFPAISDDLVNSYHLLLCCVDLLFANAVIARRKNLLRAEFEGLPPGFLTDSMDLQNDSPPCIIDHLCSVFEGLVLEAKQIKEHFWKPYLDKKFDTRDLHGNRENLSGLLDPNNFENNCKNIRREYDEYVLKKGDFDERVFLEEDAHKQIGSPSKRDGADRNMSDEVSARRALKLEKHPQNFIPQTPLTNRRYLKEKEIRITPVSTATQIVSRLQALLSGQKSSPSEELSSMFQKCKENPSETILARVKEMGQTFCEKYTQPSDHGTGSPMDFAKRRLSLAESLYYSVLEKITKNEIQRLSESQDLSGLLGHETFHSCLFACCLEIIIFAYNSQRVFPWILEVFNLHGYYFYRVIELLLRAEDGLPRDIVKHLNRTEEMILQEKAWAGDSPLWQALEDCDREVPMCADCTPPNQVEAASPTQGSVMPQTMMSPMRHPRIQELSGPLHNKEVHSKPVSTASLPCSPASNNNNVTTTASAPTTPVKTQTVILTIKEAPVGHNGGQQGGSTTVIPQSKGSDTLTTETVTQQQTLSSSYIKPKRTGSLGMFFRKVYHVLNIRLRDMCAKLSISEELRRKIWTCLEHCLVNHINMMKDRNIDQLLLCSIYIICRVTDQPNSFQNIMKCYRRQPQADSHVYRSVLLSKNDSPQKGGATTRKEKTLPQTPEKQKGK
ncbi:hypothetical protein BSL78_29976 [Apostichopus japonicus]|uniref:Retinoblastoma-like protein 1 n=1 Tax=Stichopus japonicus TaxID=307972 RepID=A0A2G8JBU5_STIJA|nr:hypothetical protein BSL78_29976 [Apostichopus japonicus]